MPKRIEDLREKIIAKTREILFSQGLEAVTVRNVSKELSIAPGTIYNYFQSKEVMLASVFLEDWMDLLKETQIKVRECRKAIDVCETVFEMIVSYSRRFSPLWSQSSIEFSEKIRQRHRMLKSQIASLLSSSDAMGCMWTENLDMFIAEILLTYAQETGFSEIRPFLIRLLDKETNK